MKYGRNSRKKSIALFALILGLLVPHGPGPKSVALSTTSGSASASWTGAYTPVQHLLPNPGSEPWEITTAANGDVWFVEQKANVLGEFVPSTGTFNEYPIPTPGATPDGVAVDKDGNVWFSELTTDKLGELPAGSTTIVEHNIPLLKIELGTSSTPINCGPGAVLPDPSGSIWVACLFSGQIDEYFPSRGSFYTYNLPLFYSAPAGLALDGKGDLWFTAADVQMLGEAVISQLVNGTTDGIQEFAPVNSTYPYKFTLTTSFLGAKSAITSSLPTPSGIAMDSHGNFWVTEHVDSSFDMYNPSSKSITRYWTSQTYGAHGFDVSFPNGIVVDGNDTVWIGEHYGNKIAEFVPSTGTMVEYPLACCKSDIAGLYAVSLDPSGGVWFVEINGDAIGDLVKVQDPMVLGLSLPQTAFTLGGSGSVSIPLRYDEGTGSPGPTNLTLSVSGISGTGALENATGSFADSTLSLSPGSAASTSLTLQLRGLNPGVYYITLGAAASPSGDVYSLILKATVSSGAFLSTDILVLLAAGIAAAGGAGWWALSRRGRSRGRLRRRNSRRTSRASATTTAATAAPA